MTEGGCCGGSSPAGFIQERKRPSRKTSQPAAGKQREGGGRAKKARKPEHPETPGGLAQLTLTSRNLFHCPTSLSYWEIVVSHCLSSRKFPLSDLPPAPVAAAAIDPAAATAGLHQAAAHTQAKAATLNIWGGREKQKGGLAQNKNPGHREGPSPTEPVGGGERGALLV